MGLLQETSYQYYEGSQVIVASAGQQNFVVLLDPLPKNAEKFLVSVNDIEIVSSNYTYNSSTGLLTFTTGLNVNDVVLVDLKNKSLGKYRYTTINDIVNNYMVGFVGDDKIINNVKKSDILFHTKRGIQEFSYDISRVEKIQEVEIGFNLSIPMPQDYINYVKLSWSDDNGIERLIYPVRYSARPSESPMQDENYNYLYDQEDNILVGTSITDAKFKDFDNKKITGDVTETSYEPKDLMDTRFGLNPETSTKNGGFIIDEAKGVISFTSDMVDRIVILRYISDGIGTDDEVKVHKFAEDALYKYITHAVASSKSNMPEYIINRFRKERRAAMRNAKLRLSNIKLEEITQVMRGKSKTIK